MCVSLTRHALLVRTTRFGVNIRHIGLVRQHMLATRSSRKQTLALVEILARYVCWVGSFVSAACRRTPSYPPIPPIIHTAATTRFFSPRSFLSAVAVLVLRCRGPGPSSIHCVLTFGLLWASSRSSRRCTPVRAPWT